MPTRHLNGPLTFLNPKTFKKLCSVLWSVLGGEVSRGSLWLFRPSDPPPLHTYRYLTPFLQLAYVPTCRNLGRDLQRIADEVARIDREFEGAVNFTVVPDSKFEVVLDTFNVSFRSRSGRGLVVTLIHVHSSRSFGISITQRSPPSYQVSMCEMGLGARCASNSLR